MKISAGAETKIVPMELPGRSDGTHRHVSVPQTLNNAWLVFLEVLSMPDPVSSIGSDTCLPSSPGHWRESSFFSGIQAELDVEGKGLSLHCETSRKATWVAAEVAPARGFWLKKVMVLVLGRSASCISQCCRGSR